MRKTNFNFKDIKGALTRDEMKQIKGGCGSGGSSCSCSAGGSWTSTGPNASSLCWEYCESAPSYGTCTCY